MDGHEHYYWGPSICLCSCAKVRYVDSVPFEYVQYRGPALCVSKRTMLSTAIIRLSTRGRVPAEAAAAVLSSRFNAQCSLRGGSNNNNSSRSISSTALSCCHPTIIIANNQQRVLQHQHQNQIQRWFASDATTKNGDSEEVDTATTATDDNDGNNPSSVSGSSQHDTWVQFQRSIAVSGFETGQTIREKDLGKKNRGGKVDRKRKEREAEAEAALRGEDVTQVSNKHFYHYIFKCIVQYYIVCSMYGRRD